MSQEEPRRQPIADRSSILARPRKDSRVGHLALSVLRHSGVTDPGALLCPSAFGCIGTVSALVAWLRLDRRLA